LDKTAKQSIEIIPVLLDVFYTSGQFRLKSWFRHIPNKFKATAVAFSHFKPFRNCSKSILRLNDRPWRHTINQPWDR